MAKNKLILEADALESCLDAIAELKAQLKPFEEQEEHLRSEIVKTLLKQGLQFIKTSSGLSFGIVQGRTTFSIKDGETQKAIAWAQANYPGLLSLKMADTTKVLKPMLEIPPFFEEKVGEAHLAVRMQED